MVGLCWIMLDHDSGYRLVSKHGKFPVDIVQCFPICMPQFPIYEDLPINIDIFLTGISQFSLCYVVLRIVMRWIA
jgi:hypothetical protein